MPDQFLAIGGLRVPYEQARDWATDYLDAGTNRTSDRPYAYPGYDTYLTDADDPDRVTQADLFAPVLLNVQISVRTFYALDAIRDQITDALPARDIGPLTDADPATVAETCTRLYGLLDPPHIRPSGVKGTVLSKIVHRKRPDFLVLHDTQVAACYRDVPGAPVPKARHRTWSEYMTLVSLAIREDLRRQHDTWDRLHAETARPENPPVTTVRLLDIVAWNAGQNPTRFLT